MNAEARVDAELVNDGLVVSIARVVSSCLVYVNCGCVKTREASAERRLTRLLLKM